MQLRPYQLDMVQRTREAFRTHRRVIMQAPTGAGKTRVAAFITKCAEAKGGDTLVLTHRKEIKEQLLRALREADVDCGEFHMSDPFQCQVGTIGVVANALGKGRWMEPNFIVVDEGHHAISTQFTKVLSAFPKAAVLFLTATPQRLDGRGLNEVADTIVLGPSMRSLIADGWLKRPVYYAPKELVDVSGLRRTAGDYNHQDLEKLMAKPSVTGNAVAEYQRLCAGRTALAFCVTVAHAEAVAAAFRSAGIQSESMDGKLSGEERAARLTRLSSGESKVLTSCELISEGFDCMDDKFEILTPEGWVGIGKIKAGDEMYSLNRETMKIEVAPVLAYHERPMKRGEKMVRVKSQHIDWRLTEGHEIHYRSKQDYNPGGMSLDFRTKTIGEIARWKKPFIVPVSGETDMEFPGIPMTDEQVRLLGWFMTDGYRCKHGTVSLYQTKPAHVLEIRNLLERSGWFFSEKVSEVVSGFKSNAKLHKFCIFKGNSKKSGYGLLSPYFDRSFYSGLHLMTKHQFEIFWESAIKGDGTVQPNKRSLGTLCCSSKSRCDGYMQLAVLRGYGVMHGNYTTKNKCLIYNIRIRPRQWIGMAPTDKRSAKFTFEEPRAGERVWCVTNRNSTLICRRTGRVAIIGNCPGVGAVISLRPTQSLTLHLQQLGRGLRPAREPDCIILDHAGNCFRHGLAEDDREWTLEGRPRGRATEPAIEVHRCEECYAMFQGGECPQCGVKRAASPREIAAKEGELRQIFEVAKKINHRQEERACNSLADWQDLAQRRGWKPQAAYMRWNCSWKSKIGRKIKA